MCKNPSLLIAFVVLATVVTRANAQHGGDILVDYQAGRIYIEPGSEGLVFESTFHPPNFLLGEPLPFTDEPGFDTLGEVTGVYGLVPGDIIGYNVLGPLVYHNGSDILPAPVDLLIIKGTTATVAASSGFQGPFGIGFVVEDEEEDGNPIGIFHQHVEFNLSSALAPFGAYGLRLQLMTTNTDIASSEPFWIVFNWGLPEADFERALEEITTPVPEASTLLLVGIGLSATFGWQRLRWRGSALRRSSS